MRACVEAPGTMQPFLLPHLCFPSVFSFLIVFISLVSSGLLAVLANVAFGRLEVKRAILAAGGLDLILCHTRSDKDAPLTREWALFAVRNMCEDFVEAQVRGCWVALREAKRGDSRPPLYSTLAWILHSAFCLTSSWAFDRWRCDECVRRLRSIAARLARTRPASLAPRRSERRSSAPARARAPLRTRALPAPCCRTPSASFSSSRRWTTRCCNRPAYLSKWTGRRASCAPCGTLKPGNSSCIATLPSLPSCCYLPGTALGAPLHAAALALIGACSPLIDGICDLAAASRANAPFETTSRKGPPF